MDSGTEGSIAAYALFRWLPHLGPFWIPHLLMQPSLTLGPSESPTCLCNLETIKGVCHHLRVSLALEKVEGPSQSLTFLGIVLDTRNMEACLPHEKLQRIRDHVATWLVRHKATKRQILSRPINNKQCFMLFTFLTFPFHFFRTWFVKYVCIKVHYFSIFFCHGYSYMHGH